MKDRSLIGGVETVSLECGLQAQVTRAQYGYHVDGLLQWELPISKMDHGSTKAYRDRAYENETGASRASE